MWSAIRRSHDLPTPAATCPTSPRQRSFHQTGGAWGCFLMLARVPGVTGTTQLRLLEQKSRALMACVTNEESGHGSGLRLGWISGQEPATIFSCFLCQGILFRLVLSVGGTGGSLKHQTPSQSGRLSRVCLGPQAHP